MLFPSCGNNKSVPDGATMTIDPSTVTLKGITGDTPINFRVIVRYADGTPIPYAQVHITGAFAEPVVGALYQFYYYPDGTLNPQGNSPVDSGFNGQTGKDGVYEFSVEVYGPASTFSDDIHASSGTASAKTTLSSS